MLSSKDHEHQLSRTLLPSRKLKVPSLFAVAWSGFVVWLLLVVLYPLVCVLVG